jgi:hypothetical protein
MIHMALHGQHALWASMSVLKGCAQHEVCTCRFNTAYQELHVGKEEKQSAQGVDSSKYRHTLRCALPHLSHCSRHAWLLGLISLHQGCLQWH